MSACITELAEARARSRPRESGTGTGIGTNRGLRDADADRWLRQAGRDAESMLRSISLCGMAPFGLADLPPAVRQHELEAAYRGIRP